MQPPLSTLLESLDWVSSPNLNKTPGFNVVASSQSGSINSSLGRFGGITELPNNTDSPDIGVISPDAALELQESPTLSLGAPNNQINNSLATSGLFDTNQASSPSGGVGSPAGQVSPPTRPPPGVQSPSAGAAKPDLDPSELVSLDFGSLDCDSVGMASSLAVDTDKVVYTPSQFIKLYLFTSDAAGCPVNAQVEVTATKLGSDPDSVVYQQSFTVNGTYNRNFGLSLEDTGKYNITAHLLNSGIATSKVSWTVIEVKEFIHTRPALMLISGLASFGGLLILLALGKTNSSAGQILRFVFISGIIFSIIGSFTFVNDEISGYSPIGLIKKPPISGEWMINIGGNVRSGYENSGLQIPISVVIFGIIGGYLRYLYHLANYFKNHKKEIMSEIASSTASERLLDRLRNFYQSLEDIAILFLAPLLAIAVYFLLKVFGLEGDNAIYTIAVVSFSIGLVTEEVIRTLIQFTTSRLKREGDSTVPEKGVSAEKSVA